MIAVFVFVSVLFVLFAGFSLFCRVRRLLAVLFVLFAVPVHQPHRLNVREHRRVVSGPGPLKDAHDLQRRRFMLLSVLRKPVRRDQLVPDLQTVASRDLRADDRLERLREHLARRQVFALQEHRLRADDLRAVVAVAHRERDGDIHPAVALQLLHVLVRDRPQRLVCEKQSVHRELRRAARRSHDHVVRRGRVDQPVVHLLRHVVREQRHRRGDHHRQNDQDHLHLLGEHVFQGEFKHLPSPRFPWETRSRPCRSHSRKAPRAGRRASPRSAFSLSRSQASFQPPTGRSHS